MEWVVKATTRQFYPRERDSVPTVQEVGWVSGPDWTGAENLPRIGVGTPNRLNRNESLSLPT
jgi:hypothetical protein